MEVLTEVLVNIGFNWKVALANFVNFLIIFWILKRFAFKPIQEKIEARNKEIADGVENAKAAQAKLDEAERAYEQKIVDAKREAHLILDTAQREKELILTYAHDQAEKKSADIIDRAKDSALQEELRLKKEFKKYAAGISVAVAEKLVEQSLDEHKSRDLVERTLQEHA